MGSPAVTSFATGFLQGPPSKHSLIITTFSPTTATDNVFGVENIDSITASVAAAAKPLVGKISTSESWPNEANPVPEGARLGNAICVAGGFFVSKKKSTGHVSIISNQG